MVTGQDDHEVRLVVGNDVHVLKHCVGRSVVPLGFAHALAGGEDVETFIAFRAQEVPAALQVADKAVGLILGGYTYASDAGIDGIGQGEVDYSRFPAEVDGGLGAGVGEFVQSRTAAAGQYIGHGTAREGTAGGGGHGIGVAAEDILRSGRSTGKVPHMNVLFVAAEATPYVKVGGLADVAGALPAALVASGHDVRVLLPCYRRIKAGKVPLEGPVAATFLPLGDRSEELRVWRAAEDPVPTWLLDIPAAFDRDALYGESDDPDRFVLFSRAVLSLMQHFREVDGWQPQIVHCHDWHAALVVNYLRTRYAYTFGHIRTVFTIHNLAYQGQSSPRVLARTGLADYGLIENELGPGIANTFNFMARGIGFADVVTTVSPSYAQEIMTPAQGERLDGLLRKRRDRVTGILNGIDTDRLDPATDMNLTANYSADDTTGKSACKAALQERAGLPTDADKPLLGVVSRLVDQKGFDLLHAALPWLLRGTDAQLVLLGSGDEHLESAFRYLSTANPTRFAAKIGFDAALAQQIYAGSDMFLMPSRFEPCGLGQLMALRYGSVPVVRATGGLADTVREGWDGNGFRFHPFDAGHFIDAMNRALTAYRDRDGWKMLRERGMREDHSWTTAASHYSGVYHWALGR